MSKLSLKEQHDKINEELSKYSWKTIAAFQETFPLSVSLTKGSTEYYTLEVFSKENIDFANSVSYVYLNKSENRFEDFWNRWNRFLNLKAFL